MTTLTKERLDKLYENYLNEGGEIESVDVKFNSVPLVPISKNRNSKVAPKETMTREEVVELTGFSATKIMSMVRFGKFPKPVLFSQRKFVNRYWRRSEVVAFLENNTK